MNQSSDFLSNLDMGKVTTYQAGIMQSAAHRLLNRKTAECLQTYNLTMMEWFAVGFIHDNHRIRISEMAKELDFTMPYATNLVNGLEGKGFVLRVDDDRDSRSKPLQLTEAAVSKYSRIEEDLRQQLREIIYSRVSVADFHTYIRVLYELGAQGDLTE